MFVKYVLDYTSRIKYPQIPPEKSPSPIPEPHMQVLYDVVLIF